jgi:hypothetical protein
MHFKNCIIAIQLQFFMLNFFRHIIFYIIMKKLTKLLELRIYIIHSIKEINLI